MPDYKMISSDSHMSEPLDLWVSRVDKAYRDRAPQALIDPPGKKGTFITYEGLPPHPVGIGVAAGKSNEEKKDFFDTADYPADRPGADPAGRIRDNELDGVEAEVLYTTLGFRTFWLKDAGLQEACFRAYNDWLAEFCSYDPKRLVGLGMISLYDPKEGAKELERCAELGLKGAAVWSSPPESQPYSSDIYDPFWAAAQEMNLPVSLHVVTGMRGVGRDDPAPGDRYKGASTQAYEIQESLSRIILSGVLERFPTLTVISAEYDCGWLPFFFQKLDARVERGGFDLSLKPSEYFQRQMYATYIDDYVGVGMRDLIGADRMMWSSDYPHAASTWPNSQDYVNRDFEGANEEDRYKITRGNVAKLYGFDP